MVNWADQHKKRGATELLMMKVMNIEGSCYEDDEDGNEREREREQANKKELTKRLDTVYTKKSWPPELKRESCPGLMGKPSLRYSSTENIPEFAIMQ